MARVAVIGEPLRIYGYGLAGAVLCPVSDQEQAARAWRDLPGDVAVAVLTPSAAGWLAAEIARRPGVLRVLLPDGGRAGCRMSLLATQDAALEPVRAAMLRRATEQAEPDHRAGARRGVGAGRGRRAGTPTPPWRRPGPTVPRRRAPVAAAELSRSRRAARSVALGADLAAHDEIAGRIRAAILGLRDEPGYPELRDRLASAARRAAGPRAEISEHPAGGVVARAGGVVVDCSLPQAGGPGGRGARPADRPAVRLMIAAGPVTGSAGRSPGSAARWSRCAG